MLAIVTEIWMKCEIWNMSVYLKELNVKYDLIHDRFTKKMKLLIIVIYSCHSTTVCWWLEGDEKCKFELTCHMTVFGYIHLEEKRRKKFNWKLECKWWYNIRRNLEILSQLIFIFKSAKKKLYSQINLEMWIKIILAKVKIMCNTGYKPLENQDKV